MPLAGVCAAEAAQASGRKWALVARERVMECARPVRIDRCDMEPAAEKQDSDKLLKRGADELVTAAEEPNPLYDASAKPSLQLAPWSGPPLPEPLEDAAAGVVGGGEAVLAANAFADNNVQGSHGNDASPQGAVVLRAPKVDWACVTLASGGGVKRRALVSVVFETGVRPILG